MEAIRDVLELLAPAFLLRRVLWYLVVVVIVVRLFGSKVVLNDFNLWFYFAHVLYYELPLTHPENLPDRRYHPLVAAAHPLSLCSALTCAVTFVIVIAWENTSFISERAADLDTSEALVWVSETAQVALPLLSSVVDGVVSHRHLKVAHSLRTTEDSWNLPLHKWVQVAWYLVSCPLLMMFPLFFNGSSSINQVFNTNISSTFLALYMIPFPVVVVGVLVLSYYTLHTFMDGNISIDDEAPTERSRLKPPPRHDPSLNRRSSPAPRTHAPPPATHVARGHSSAVAVEGVLSAEQRLASETAHSMRQVGSGGPAPYPPVAEDWVGDVSDRHAYTSQEALQHSDSFALYELLLKEESAVALCTCKLAKSEPAVIDAVVMVADYGRRLPDVLQDAVVDDCNRFLTEGLPFPQASVTGVIVSTYVRQVHGEFLSSCIGPIVQSYVNDPISFEMDPTRLAMPALAEAGRKHCAAFCLDIIEAVMQYRGLRDGEMAMLNHLWCTAYSHSEEMGVEDPSVVVGQLLFLHLLCPAIVMPVKMGLVAEQPKKDTIRYLKVAARTLFHAATKQLIDDGDFLSIMNKFVKEQSPRLSEFHTSLGQTKIEAPIYEEERERVHFPEVERALGEVRRFVKGNLRKYGPLLDKPF